LTCLSSDRGLPKAQIRIGEGSWIGRGAPFCLARRVDHRPPLRGFSPIRGDASIPDYSVVFGTPATIIRNTIRKNERGAWGSGGTQALPSVKVSRSPAAKV